MKRALGCLAPLLLAGCWLTSVQCFTGLTTANVRRSCMGRVSTSSSAVRGRCTHDGNGGRFGGAGIIMAAKPAVLAEEHKMDPYAVEANLVEEDKAV